MKDKCPYCKAPMRGSDGFSYIYGCETIIGNNGLLHLSDFCRERQTSNALSEKVEQLNQEISKIKEERDRALINWAQSNKSNNKLIKELYEYGEEARKVARRLFYSAPGGLIQKDALNRLKELERNKCKIPCLGYKQ